MQSAVSPAARWLLSAAYRDPVFDFRLPRVPAARSTGGESKALSELGTCALVRESIHLTCGVGLTTPGGDPGDSKSGRPHDYDRRSCASARFVECGRCHVRRGRADNATLACLIAKVRHDGVPSMAPPVVHTTSLLASVCLYLRHKRALIAAVG